MDSIRSPATPNAGAQPPSVLGRFRGKAQESDWVVIEREASEHDDEQFRRQMVGAIRTSLFEMSPKARGATTVCSVLRPY